MRIKKHANTDKMYGQCLALLVMNVLDLMGHLN